MKTYLLADTADNAKAALKLIEADDVIVVKSAGDVKEIGVVCLYGNYTSNPEYEQTKRNALSLRCKFQDLNICM